MSQSQPLTLTIPEAARGQRLDQAVARLFTDYSRARLQTWIRDGRLRVDGRVWRPRDRVKGGERIALVPQMDIDERWEPQAIPLAILYRDEDILVVEKPAGLVVHPAPGNPDRTLVNALLHRDPELARLPRAGIVHRIDKDTSGLLVVARSPRAHCRLVEQLKEHEIQREYDAVVVGTMTAGGTVDAAVGRHPVRRKEMAVTTHGKRAVTHYRVARRFGGHTHVRVRLETGRTHQIRVHMAHIHHPLVGDPVYGGRPRLPRGCGEALIQMLQRFPRQALHARKLTLVHPVSGVSMSWSSPLPQDMRDLLETLADDAARASNRQEYLR